VSLLTPYLSYPIRRVGSVSPDLTEGGSPLPGRNRGGEGGSVDVGVAVGGGQACEAE